MREGTLTATEASNLTGQSPANCSFHLRTLARYGFVEPAEGGHGRERPWKPRSISHRWTEVADDPERASAAAALTRFVVGRHFQAAQTWLVERRTFPREWQEAAMLNDALLYLTPEELAELEEQIGELTWRRYLDRLDPARRPAGARPVRFFAYGIPVRPTPKGN